MCLSSRSTRVGWDIQGVQCCTINHTDTFVLDVFTFFWCHVCVNLRPSGAPSLAWTCSTWEISRQVQRSDWCLNSAAPPPNFAKEVTLIKVLCGETGLCSCCSTDIPAPPRRAETSETWTNWEEISISVRYVIHSIQSSWLKFILGLSKWMC